MMWNWEHYGWGVIAMWVGMTAFWTVVAWLLITLVRSPTERHRAPEEILADRFARGEIDAEEYRQRADALHRGSRR